MNNLPTKTCAFCAETISTIAKVCPRCRQWQTIKSFANPVIFISTFTFAFCALGIAFTIWLQRIVEPGPDFALFRNSLTVVESKLVFYKGEKDIRLRTLVVVTNQGINSWKDIEAEVRYFDKNRKLIDARTYTTRDIIFGHDELALAIESTPCHPQSDYFSHEVFVRAARSSHSWP